MAKRKARYLWDVDPSFPDWWERNKKYNPGIDPKKLRANDKKTVLAYRPRDSDKIDHIKVCVLYKRKDKDAPFSKKEKLLKDYPEFADWFDPALNPGIDPDTLKANDNRTKLCYKRRDSGCIDYVTPKQLHKRKDWYAPSKKKRFAIDVPSVKDWWARNRDLNLGVDISSLSVNTRKIRLNEKSSSGNIHAVSVRRLCNRKNMDYEPTDAPLCVDFPDFQEWFTRFGYLNNAIDIATVRINNSTIQLKYMVNGEVRTITPFRLCTRNDMLVFIRTCINDDPVFWDYCVEQDRETVNSYIKNSKKKKMQMQCPHCGCCFDMTPGEFYTRIEADKVPCPCCAGKAGLIQGVNDAATVDPEIVIFYSDKNPRPPNMVGACNGHDDFFFKCPYCGHEFTRRMKNICGRHPKCPKCHDTGLPDFTRDSVIGQNVPYLIYAINEETK